MSFVSANREYEAWLHQQCDVDQAALDYKHERMKKNAFTFLRATFFRWAATIENICPEFAGAPAVLSVGDLHLENFGTWRDAEGRLVWGVNDFDEAAEIPYAFDLVRLVTSALLAPDLMIEPHHVAALLDGYKSGLAKPRPTLLDEQERWARPLVACSDHERRKFWKEMHSLPRVPKPAEAAPVLEGALPHRSEHIEFATRTAGGGSLGRPRFVAVARWQGGKIVREAKALVPSAWYWAHPEKTAPSVFMDIAGGSHRSADPFLAVAGKWVVRRLGPDSRKIDLDEDFEPKLFGVLFDAMGFDLGSIHAAGDKTPAILADLNGREPGWLLAAAEQAKQAVEADFAEWKGSEAGDADETSG